MPDNDVAASGSSPPGMAASKPGPETQPTPAFEWGEHCPDCGCDPKDDTLHRDGCRRIFEKGDPRERLQFGPPWLPWRDA